MRTLRTVAEIEAVEAGLAPLWVRYTSDPEGDLRRGVSRNHQTGEAEAGLSVVRLLSGDKMLGSVSEYIYLPGDAYLMTGYAIGTGSDGEPLIRPTGIAARITRGAVHQCRLAECQRRLRSAEYILSINPRSGESQRTTETRRRDVESAGRLDMEQDQ